MYRRERLRREQQKLKKIDLFYKVMVKLNTMK